MAGSCTTQVRMEDDRIPKQAMYWQMDHHVKRKPGRPGKNWIDTICQDLKTIGMAWEEAEESAANREVRLASNCGPMCL